MEDRSWNVTNDRPTTKDPFPNLSAGIVFSYLLRSLSVQYYPLGMARIPDKIDAMPEVRQIGFDF